MNNNELLLACGEKEETLIENCIPIFASKGDLQWNTDFPEDFTYNLDTLYGVPAQGFTNCLVDDTKKYKLSFPNLKKINGLQSAFRYCTNLTAISFPLLTDIGAGLEYGFQECTNLTSISFPKLTDGTQKKAFHAAFNGCTNLTSVSFPNLTTAGYYTFYSAFSKCTKLTSASFPNLTSTSSYAFYFAFSESSNLTSVSFPNLTTVLGYSGFSYAFKSCTKLTSVSFPKLTTFNYKSIFNYTGHSGLTIHLPKALSSSGFYTNNCGTLVYDL